MIKRIWHGYTTPERADEYEALLRAEVIKGIEGKNIPGFWGIDVLRRPLGDEVEFITIMDFESLDSVKAFVGEHYEQAYVPDEARAILSRFDEKSQHYEVREQRSYSDATLAQAASAGSAAATQPATGSHAATSTLPEGVWFVRSNKGSGSFPVTREGFRVMRNYIFGLLGWAVVGGAVSAYGVYQGPRELIVGGPLVFAAGAVLTAIYFIYTARKHTDFAMTYNDYVKARRNA
ncbi:MAG: antibiotic biosynthesis monooxygenase [Rhizobiaceae bacterium]